MKYFASLFVLVLVGSLPEFATSVHHTSLNSQNQFHFKPSKRRAAQVAAHIPTAKHAQSTLKTHGPTSKMAGRKAQSHRASAKNVRRHTLNPPTGKTGFLSAMQIPAGGGPYWSALSGDFNGDGNPDIASEVEYYDTNSS